MPEPVVIVEKQDRVALVTLNRPEAMNALSNAVRGGLTRAFLEADADDDVGVVILTGAGERAFSAGLDLKELSGEAPASDSGSAAAVASGDDLVRAMEACSKPIIGAINGVAITGGFEIALACDVLIGTTNARFADTHARVGIMPGWGLSQKLSRLVGIYRAKELSLTGNFVDAEQAERWGLLNRVVAPAELIPACRALATDMLSCQPQMLRAYKAVIDRGFAETFGRGREIERDENRAATVSADAIRSVRENVMKRGRTQ